MAPGPPSATAVDTPIILPVPSVAAKAVVSVAKEEVEEVLSDEKVSLSDLKVCFWTNFNLKVKNRWTPNNRIIIGAPQRILFILFNVSKTK